MWKLNAKEGAIATKYFYKLVFGEASDIKCIGHALVALNE